MFFREFEYGEIGHGHRLAVGTILRTVNSQLQLYNDKKWKYKLEDELARRGQDAGGNKLRTYIGVLKRGIPLSLMLEL